MTKTMETGMDEPLDLPECNVCRKKSDGAIQVFNVAPPLSGYLCGTHFDAFARSPEFQATPPDWHTYSTAERFAAFVERLRYALFGPCWETPSASGAASEAPPKIVWLTRDECIAKHHFDPTGYPEDTIKSKLRRDVDGAYRRVWHEEAIVAKCEELTRVAEKMRGETIR